MEKATSTGDEPSLQARGQDSPALEGTYGATFFALRPDRPLREPSWDVVSIGNKLCGESYKHWG